VIRKLKSLGRLASTELSYRIGRISKQRFRFDSASSLEALGEYRRCIGHCEQFLLVYSNDVVRGRLAYCYGEIGDWEKAADTYRSMKDVWRDPMDALGLVLSELRAGRPSAAQRAFKVAELAHGHRSGNVQRLMNILRHELSAFDFDSNDA